ncbi:MAG: PfkB family carbohydrate kinase [Candidatus Bathyarchaeia archaeon]
MFDIATISHFVIDLITSPKISCPTPTLGGPPTFVSLTASKLGAKVGVVSKVGKDFHRHFVWLRKNNVDLSHVQVFNDSLTTSFILRYDGNKRALRLKANAPPLTLKDVCALTNAKAIHVAPVANELSAEMVQQLRAKTDLLSIDPQGFLRDFDKTGNVKPKILRDTSFLQNCDVLKSSIDEVKLVTGNPQLRASMRKIRELGVKTALVTMGRKGTLAYIDKDVYHIPSCKPKMLKDPTGAGDAFIGGFLAEYIGGKEPVWCCCVGSAAASFVVEEVGAQRFGEKNEVYQRATEIYEKGINPLSRNHLESVCCGKNR